MNKDKIKFFSTFVAGTVLSVSANSVVAYSCDDDNSAETPSVFVESEEVCMTLHNNINNMSDMFVDRYSDPERENRIINIKTPDFDFFRLSRASLKGDSDKIKIRNYFAEKGIILSNARLISATKLGETKYACVLVFNKTLYTSMVVLY